VRLPETRYARSGDFRIAYQVVGQGALDLVLVPGFLSNLELQREDPGYSRLMRRLSGFARLIRFDKRGTGLSDRVDPAHLPDLETRMDDVRAVMDAAGSGRAAILGTSEGAPMALMFAAAYPERTRALVLYGGYAHFHRWVMSPECVERFVAEVESSWGSGATLRAMAPGRASDPHFAAWWARFERLSCSPTAAIALARMNEEVDLRGILPSIRVPTLVLHRMQDARVDPEAGRYLARRIPGAVFRPLEGRDHPLWTGDVDAAVDVIEEFLTGMPPHAEPPRVLAALLAWRCGTPRLHGVPVGDRAWAEALHGFGAAVAETARRFGGRAVRGDAEGGTLRFDGPARAVRCAVALRAAAAARRLPLAQGVHVGELELVAAGEAGETAAGLALCVARHIAAAARPGEILASALAAELCAGSGEHFADRAPLSVEGVGRPLALCALVVEQHLEPARRARPAAVEVERLSPREREVLALVAEGLSNPAIAERLGLSEHTAKRHVANILTKLDLPSRSAAAALMARRG
jgi:pimeloyl-ACP methyl ester carboxylesterase/DNA-binding CsgD family transcriptional regulator